MKRVFITNFIFLAILIFNTVCFNITNIFAFKCLASTSFVILAIINYVFAVKAKSSKLKIATLMLIGIIFAMGGDVSINSSFELGAAVFALGHLFYFFTYCKIRKLCLKDFIVSGIIFVGITCFLFLTPIFDFGEMAIVVVVYCVIICGMTGKSLVNIFYDPIVSNKLFALGSVMFFISDVMLVLNLFADTTRLTYILCHSIYFPAQWILAYGIFSLAKNK